MVALSRHLVANVQTAVWERRNRKLRMVCVWHKPTRKNFLAVSLESGDFFSTPVTELNIFKMHSFYLYIYLVSYFLSCFLTYFLMYIFIYASMYVRMYLCTYFLTIHRQYLRVEFEDVILWHTEKSRKCKRTNMSMFVYCRDYVYTQCPMSFLTRWRHLTYHFPFWLLEPPSSMSSFKYCLLVWNMYTNV